MIVNSTKIDPHLSATFRPKFKWQMSVKPIGFFQNESKPIFGDCEQWKTRYLQKPGRVYHN